MTPAPVFDRAYALVKHRLRTGVWRPGQRLDLPELASELDASFTPLRDALHRLVGEGLLDWGAADGFAVPVLTEPDLRDLYAWHLDVTLNAWRAQRSSPTAMSLPSSTDVNAAAATEAFFSAIGVGSLNREHAAALAATADRLHPARRAEATIFLDIRAELDALIQTIRARDARRVSALLTGYHRRRIRAVGQIAHRLHRPAFLDE